MSNVRVEDVYEATKDAIIKIHKGKKNGASGDARYILTELLKQFIAKRRSNNTNQTTCFLFSASMLVQPSQSLDMKLAITLLGLLNPKIYPEALKHIIKPSCNTSALFQSRQDYDVISFVIGHLNARAEQLNDHGDLVKLLSAFFSMYILYRPKLNEMLLNKLKFQDYWNDYIAFNIDKIFEKMKLFNFEQQLANLRTLGQLANWMPFEMRPKAASSIMQLLSIFYASYLKPKFTPEVCEEISDIIVKLIKWFSQEEREEILRSMIGLLSHRNADISALISLTLTKLKIFIATKELNELLLKSFNDLLMILEKGDLLASIRAFKALYHLRVLVPNEIWLTFVDHLQLSLTHREESFKLVAYEALSSVSEHIPETHGRLIVHTLIVNLEDRNTFLLACNALCQVKRITSVEDKITIANKFFTLLTVASDEKQDELKIASFKGIFHYKDSLTVEQYNEVSAQLLSLASNAMVTIDDKVAIYEIFHLLNRSETVTAALLDVIHRQNEDDAIIIAALNALIVHKNFISHKMDELVAKLIEITSNKGRNETVRKTACSALSLLKTCIPRYLLPNILNKLLELLKDKNEIKPLRLLAAQQLGDLREICYEKTHLFLMNELVTIISNKNDSAPVRQEAFTIFFQLLQRIENESQEKFLNSHIKKIIDETLLQMNDKFASNRLNACECFRQVSTWLPRNVYLSVIDALIQRIGDDNIEVKANVYKILHHYILYMSDEQKVATLSCIKSQEYPEMNGIILFAEVYSAYRSSIAFTTMRAFIHTNNAYIPVDKADVTVEVMDAPLERADVPDEVIKNIIMRI